MSVARCQECKQLYDVNCSWPYCIQCMSKKNKASHKEATYRNKDFVEHKIALIEKRMEQEQAHLKAVKENLKDYKDSYEYWLHKLRTQNYE